MSYNAAIMEMQDKYAEVRQEFAWYLEPENDHIPLEMQPFAQEIFGKLSTLALKANSEYDINDTSEGWFYALDNGVANLASLWVSGALWIGEEPDELVFYQSGLFEGEVVDLDRPEIYNLGLVLKRDKDGSINFKIDYRETDEHFTESDLATFRIEKELEDELIAKGEFDEELEVSIAQSYDPIERYEGRISFTPTRTLLERINILLNEPNLTISPFGLNLGETVE